MGKRALHFQCFAGLSGDMCLAALLNIGVPEAYLREELSKLGLDSEYKLRVSLSQKMGVHGVRVDVDTHIHDHSHGSRSGHDHGHQRDYKKIQSLLGESSLSDSVKARAFSIFNEIARAEAHIHNVPLDSVHFHEVGAVDSIVDIVGSAIGIEYLIEEESVERILCSTLELGRGTVECAHGIYPIPAPATAEILQGVPVSQGNVRGEATTPTGASILKACVDEFEDQISGTSLKTVYGIGHRDTDVPNVVRLQLVELSDIRRATDPENQSVYRYAKIEANIDDMSPEAFEPLFDRLFRSGASDVFLQSIVMKKSRLAYLLSVLCKENDAERLGELVLNHTTTIGLRILPFRKMFLPREIVSVETSWGPIAAKLVMQPDGTQRFKSEHDDLMKLSRKTGEAYLTLKSRVDSEIDAFLANRSAPTTGDFDE